MKIRRLLSLLLAAILCFTVAISLMACEDDPAEEDETTEAGETVEGGEVEGEGGEVAEEGGEEAVG